MTETSTTLPIEIRSIWDNSVIYTGRAGKSLRATVVSAAKSRADLSRANLSRADLSRANLSRADLSGADLSRADLSRAYLFGANLSGANLSGADLSGAYLSGADLSGANLSGADLSGAYLSRANLSRAYLSRAKYNDSPIISTASVAFTGHGERGRTLLGIRTEKGIHLDCGCFSGSPEELTEYIKRGDEKYKTTRTLALTLVIILLHSENDK